MTKSNKGITLIILIIIFITLAIFVLPIAGEIYLILSPQPNEKFTEFQVLGPDGTNKDYPTSLSVGQSGNVTINIINHENMDTNYQLIIKFNQKILMNKNITLADNEQKKISFKFAPSKGNDQKLEFLLYKLPDTQKVYRSTFMYVNVA